MEPHCLRLRRSMLQRYTSCCQGCPPGQHDQIHLSEPPLRLQVTPGADPQHRTELRMRPLRASLGSHGGHCIDHKFRYIVNSQGRSILSACLQSASVKPGLTSFLLQNGAENAQSCVAHFHRTAVEPGQLLLKREKGIDLHEGVAAMVLTEGDDLTRLTLLRDFLISTCISRCAFIAVSTLCNPSVCDAGSWMASSKIQ